MATEPEPLKPARPPGLTLRQLMIAVAGLAVSYAILFQYLAIILSIIVIGILILKGLRCPVITDGPGLRRWLPWGVWGLMLAACPIALVVFHDRYRYRGPATVGLPPMDPVRLWALEQINVFAWIHLGLSILAAISVVILTRGYHRWIAWGVIVIDNVVGFGIAISTYESICGWSR